MEEDEVEDGVPAMVAHDDESLLSNARDTITMVRRRLSECICPNLRVALLCMLNAGSVQGILGRSGVYCIGY